jgi:hypothetical protein
LTYQKGFFVFIGPPGKLPVTKPKPAGAMLKNEQYYNKQSYEKEY